MKPAFMVMLLMASVLPSSAWAFEYFEHRAIGNAAFERARAQAHPRVAAALQEAAQDLGLGLEVAQGNSPLHTVPLRFGDLAALAGDFTQRPEDLGALLQELRALKWSTGWRLLESRASGLMMATRHEWLTACQWAYRARAIDLTSQAVDDDCLDALLRFEADAAAAGPHRYGSAGFRPSRAHRAGYEQIENYVKLASRNGSHFPQYAWVSYRDHHRRALRLADCFAREAECDGARDAGLLRLALLHEAFAQHFLQDSFASGHIGTETSECIDLMVIRVVCTPTLARMQQTHDALNEFGVDVRLVAPMPHVQEQVHAQARQGWTAFGDGHLFIREADFHRAMLLQTATASIGEVFERASRPEDAETCRLCTSALFPVPVNDFGTGQKQRQQLDLSSREFKPAPLIAFEPMNAGLDRRSPDPRVPGIAVEGWKVGFGLAKENARSVPAAGGPPITRDNNGLMLKVDYIRPTEPGWPTVYGFETWNVPRRGWSYMLTAGWTWPSELSNTALTLKLKLGWQLDDNFTASNPSPDRRRSLDLVAPTIEYTYEIYRPLAIFVQANLLKYSLTNDTASSSKTQGQLFAFGLRFDLAGI